MKVKNGGAMDKKRLLCLIVGTLALIGVISQVMAEDGGCQYTQKILFQSGYYNFAWGKQCHGWIIDNSGNVISFDKCEDVEGNFNNLKDNVILTIDKQELCNKYKLLESAAKGKLSEERFAGADMGQFTFEGYYENEKTGEVKTVLLNNQGDVQEYNLDPDAIELTKWLEEINTKVVNVVKDKKALP